MSSAAGPSIATSGLVLDIDMSNTQKSWLGKPTTNLVITKVEDYAGWSTAGWWMHPGNTTSVTSQTLPDGNTGLTLTATTLTTGGLYGYNGYALGAAYVNGTQYTASFWAKSYNGVASLNVRDADAGGTLSTGVSGITDTWQRFSFTWIANASTNMLTFTGSNFSLYNVQLETNSFATPFVVGTRSSTQAIVDLTGQDTLTATSLTYASNGTFSFTSANNSIITGASRTISFANGVSFEVVVNLTDLTSRAQGCLRFTGAGSQGATNYLDIYFPGNGKVRWETIANYPNGVLTTTSFISASTLANNTTYHILCTATAAGAGCIYINGVLDATATFTSPVFGTVTTTMGTEHGGYPSGSIPVAKIYNRALSAAEVAQNFNATRSRYGL